jgi:hypothetical protein
MTPSVLQFGLPLCYGNLVFFPVVRQVLVRTPAWFSCAATPVAIIILEEKDVYITMLDDGFSQRELTCWLKERGVFI